MPEIIFFDETRISFRIPTQKLKCVRKNELRIIIIIIQDCLKLKSSAILKKYMTQNINISSTNSKNMKFKKFEIF